MTFYHPCPEVPEFTGTRLISIGVDYGTSLTEKEISSEFETSIDSTDKTVTISTIMATAVV